MREGWVETTLGELAVLAIGKTPPRKDPEYWSESLERPFCTIADMGDWWVAPGREGVSELAEAEGKAKRVPAGSLIMSFKLTIGRIGFAETDIFPNEAIVWIQPGPEALPEYLALWLDYSDLEEFAGRAVKGKTLNGPSLRAIPVVLPPLAEQRRIVDLIGAVDEYVAAREAELEAGVSARAAALAEELGRGGDDWVETTLGDVADYINGFPFKPSDLGTEGLPVIRIKQLLDPTETPDYSTVEVPERNLLGDGDLVFSWSGTLAVRRWDRGVAVLNQHLFRVVEKVGVDSGWLQFALDHAIDELLLKTHGTTMKHITKGSLLPHRVVLPPFPEQRRIAELIGAFDEANDALRGEIAAARASRAALLTELLSGDYEIPNSYDDLMDNES